MTKAEQLRAYIPEPIAAVLGLSLAANFWGKLALANFMHAEARDSLSLLTVLLGASLALWIGLFWISSTSFGQWLASQKILETINSAYITSIAILLLACLSCIFCAYLSSDHTYVQLSGIFINLYGMATVPTMLNNTHKLLGLHAFFGRQSSKVTDMRSASFK
jgi:hypothetical protein